PNRVVQGALLHGGPEDADLAGGRGAVRAPARAVADRRRDHRARVDGQADREALRPPDGHRVGGRQGPARGRKHLHSPGTSRDGLERSQPAGGDRRGRLGDGLHPVEPAAGQESELTSRSNNGADMNARTEVGLIDDLRSYIAALEANGQLHRVKAEVDWKYELCHVSKVNEEKQGPALLFENVKGNSIPVLTSAFTPPQRIAIALEQDPSLTMCQLSRKWMELTTKQMVKPTFVDNRSEERRVGKECRHRCETYRFKKNCRIYAKSTSKKSRVMTHR